MSQKMFIQKYLKSIVFGKQNVYAKPFFSQLLLLLLLPFCLIINYFLSLLLCLSMLSTVYRFLLSLSALIMAEQETMGLLTDRPFSQRPGSLSFPATGSQKWLRLCTCSLHTSIMNKPNGRPGYPQISSQANSVSLLSHQSDGKMKDAGKSPNYPL